MYLEVILDNLFSFGKPPDDYSISQICGNKMSTPSSKKSRKNRQTIFYNANVWINVRYSGMSMTTYC